MVLRFGSFIRISISSCGLFFKFKLTKSPSVLLPTYFSTTVTLSGHGAKVACKGFCQRRLPQRLGALEVGVDLGLGHGEAVGRGVNREAIGRDLAAIAQQRRIEPVDALLALLEEEHADDMLSFLKRLDGSSKEANAAYRLLAKETRDNLQARADRYSGGSGDRKSVV
mgnify:CR=1 FL=1